MNRHRMEGGCHCGQLSIAIELTAPPFSFHPRACDCGFCLKHGAAYLSDPNGMLELRAREPQNRGAYRQGSEAAEFVICKSCGIMIAVVCREGDRTYAAVNVNALSEPHIFGETQVISPMQLSALEKTQRWRQVWFHRVSEHES